MAEIDRFLPAKQRDRIKRRAEAALLQKSREDASWKVTDKDVIAKERRKSEKELKNRELERRKAEKNEIRAKELEESAPKLKSSMKFF